MLLLLFIYTNANIQLNIICLSPKKKINSAFFLQGVNPQIMTFWVNTNMYQKNLIIGVRDL